MPFFIYYLTSHSKAVTWFCSLFLCTPFPLPLSETYNDPMKVCELNYQITYLACLSPKAGGFGLFLASPAPGLCYAAVCLAQTGTCLCLPECGTPANRSETRRSIHQLLKSVLTERLTRNIRAESDETFGTVEEQQVKRRHNVLKGSDDRVQSFHVGD